MYYRYHLFFCTNRRDACDGCESHGARDMRAHAKARLKALGMSGAGAVRISSAGCLGRCELGPVAVVYPEGVWYTYVDRDDIDEIIDSHLLRGEPVARLRLPDPICDHP